MKSIGNELRDKLNEQGLQLLIQGEGLSRKNLLDKFKLDINSVLFGLDSFWLGVDVPGESLSNLILTKLPFTVPDHPLIQARLEYIDSEGGNSFMDYSLPEAVLKFRQGAGRLIRSKSDEGIITILDFRILSKQYGKYFLNALEECPIDII
jgi:ATP-dependent DNA helicase DinG